MTWNLTVTGAQTLREFISEYCYFVWNWMLVYRPGHFFTNNLQLQIYIFEKEGSENLVHCYIYNGMTKIKTRTRITWTKPQCRGRLTFDVWRNRHVFETETVNKTNLLQSPYFKTLNKALHLSTSNKIETKLPPVSYWWENESTLVNSPLYLLHISV